MSNKTIHYLGPPETFTEQAAKKFADEMGEPFLLVPHRTFAQVIATAAAEKHWAVIPYYNLQEGLIQESLDLLVEHQLTIFGAKQVAVQFAFGGYPRRERKNGECASKNNTAFPDDLTVYSHPKALAQCSDFLQKNYPNLIQQETSSTAQGVQQVERERFGFTIARREALEKHHIPVLNDDIGNRLYSRQNYTEFLLVAPKNQNVTTSTPTTSGQQRTFIAIIPTVDHVGLLADILGQIAFFGINLLKIHSRPSLSDTLGMTPQMFYLETDILPDAPEFRLCIETLNMRLSQKGERSQGVVHIIGSYKLDAINEDTSAVLT